MKKIAISFWATGNYLNFFTNWYPSFEDKFLPNAQKHYYVFTDGDIDGCPDNVTIVKIPDYGFPETFNMTFEKLYELKDVISDYDWFLSIDADMMMADTVTYEEFFDDSKSYIGVHHPCHFLGMSGHTEVPGSFDVNPDSNASVKDIIDMSVYHQGCIWGGKVSSVFDMIKCLNDWTKDDLSRGVSARFYEESYLNKWFTLKKEETHTLSSSYAFPEMFSSLCTFDAKIVHVHKNNSQFGNNSW